MLLIRALKMNPRYNATSHWLQYENFTTCPRLKKVIYYNRLHYLYRVGMVDESGTLKPLFIFNFCKNVFVFGSLFKLVK